MASRRRNQTLEAYRYFFRRHVGITPAARLTWLFGFLQAELSHATSAEWVTWRALLAGLAGLDQGDLLLNAGVLGMGSTSPISVAFGGIDQDGVEGITNCQRVVRDHLIALADGGAAETRLGDLTLIDRLAAENGKKRLRGYFLGSMASSILLAARDDLLSVGPERLRRCQLVEEEDRCTRLFLARRAQLFCSKEHTARAMYLRWKDRGRQKRPTQPR